MSDEKIFDPVTKLWSGPKVDYPYGNDSVGQASFKSLLAELNHVCQISDDSGEIYTNERLLKAGISFANALTTKGIQKGDVVVVLMHNHHYLLPTWFGCILAGVILCPFHYTDSSVHGELSDLIEQCNPKMMITSYLDTIEIFQSIFTQLDIDCPIYIYENERAGCHDLKPLLEEHFTSFEDFCPAIVTDLATEALMLTLSSATTGKPKLINVTHKQMLMQFTTGIKNMMVATSNQPGWQSEFIMIIAILVANYCRVIRAHYTMDEFLSILHKYKIQLTMVKPKDIFEILRGETIKTIDLSELVIVLSTGQHLSVKLTKEFQDYVPSCLVFSGYGISEFGGGVVDPSELDPETPNLVGRVKKGYRYYVLDEAGNRLGPLQLGEICITAEGPFAGYYKNEKLSKEATTPDGFYYTGDLGYLDDDGNIFLIERKKFNISYRGRMLNQWDVEKIIIDNVKGITAVCVVDVESDKHGVMPYIAIVPEKGVTLSELDIVKTVMEHHPFEFETGVFFFDKLPDTISGKFKKHLVREMILKELSKRA